MADFSLVLASASPRRRMLLEKLGIPFSVRPTDADESLPDATPPDLAVALLACRKALAASTDGRELVLGADTVVALGNEILGKPRDRAHARQMLESLSGQTHVVYTGICLRVPSAALSDAARALCTDAPLTAHLCVRYHAEQDCYTLSQAVGTRVVFHPLTAAQIEAYLDTDEPYDKAGAYAIQGLARPFVGTIDGDFDNVVGLPVQALRELWELAGEGAF
jgi:septum formation protein